MSSDRSLRVLIVQAGAVDESLAVCDLAVELFARGHSLDKNRRIMELLRDADYAANRGVKENVAYKAVKAKKRAKHFKDVGIKHAPVFKMLYKKQVEAAAIKMQRLFRAKLARNRFREAVRLAAEKAHKERLRKLKHFYLSVYAVKLQRIVRRRLAQRAIEKMANRARRAQ